MLRYIKQGAVGNRGTWISNAIPVSASAMGYGDGRRAAPSDRLVLVRL